MKQSSQTLLVLQASASELMSDDALEDLKSESNQGGAAASRSKSDAAEQVSRKSPIHSFAGFFWLLSHGILILSCCFTSAVCDMRDCSVVFKQIMSSEHKQNTLRFVPLHAIPALLLALLFITCVCGHCSQRCHLAFPYHGNSSSQLAIPILHMPLARRHS